MKPFVWKTGGALAVVVMALGFAATAHASHVNVRIAEPVPASVGQSSKLEATVTSADAGQPVAGMPVTFYAHASFGKVTGYMEIGRAVTDANGVATINFVPRESGSHDIRVEYALPGGGTTEQTTASVAVDGSPGQLYVQTAGIQVPGLNSWLIIGLLSTVWAILFGVGLTVVRIAAAGRVVATRAEETAGLPAAAFRTGAI